MTSCMLKQIPLASRDNLQGSASWRRRCCAALVGATALMSVVAPTFLAAVGEPDVRRAGR
jgi:hypothetical protein